MREIKEVVTVAQLQLSLGAEQGDVHRLLHPGQFGQGRGRPPVGEQQAVDHKVAIVGVVAKVSPVCVAPESPQLKGAQLRTQLTGPG